MTASSGAAANAVFQYPQSFSIAQHWGRDDLASSDTMSLQKPRQIWQARADPRRRTASIGTYTRARPLGLLLRPADRAEPAPGGRGPI
jgi:hypothetical protein